MKRAKQWRTIGTCFFLVLILVLGPVFLERAKGQWENPPVSMKVIKNSQGYDWINEEKFFSLEIESDRSFQGMVCADILTEKETYYTKTREINLEAGEKTVVDFSVIVTYATSIIRFRLMEGEEILQTEEITLSPSYNFGTIGLLAYTDTPEAFYWADDLVLDHSKEISFSLTCNNLSQIPGTLGEFPSGQILLLDAEEGIGTEPEMTGGLEAWVKAGGLLICGSIPKEGENLSGKEDEKRETVGKGEIIRCPYPLSQMKELAATYTDESLYWKKLLGERRWSELMEGILSGRMDYWDAVSGTSAVNTDRIPQVGSYVILVMGYLLLIGPVLYFSLKRNRQQGYLRLAMVGVALGFTLLVYMMGNSTRYKSPFTTWLRILQTGEGCEGERVYVNVQSPYHTPYEIHVSKDYEATFLTEESYVVPPVNWNSSRQKLEIEQTKEGTTLKIYDKIPFSQEYFLLEKKSEGGKEEGIQGEIHIFGKEITGTITNQRQERVSQVSVWTDTLWIEVGDIEPGETVDLSGCETHSSLNSYRYQLFRRISKSDFYRNAVESKEASDAFWKNAILQNFYGSEEMGTNAALVIGFFEEKEERKFLSGASEENAMTVLESHVPISYQKGSFTYYPNLKDTITTLSGFLSQTDMTCYEKELVIEVGIPGQDLVTLLFDWADSQMMDDYVMPFVGRMEFFEQGTERYVEMEQKDSYSAEELTPFLDERGCLRIRFYMTGGQEPTSSIQLPVISYIGGE